MSNHYRPMTREELESLRPIKATKENPYLQSKRVFEGAYVYAPAGTEFTSKVSRQRIGERADGQVLWKVGVEIAGGTAPGFPLGNTVQRHERTSSAGKITGHPSYRPEWLDVNFSPKTGVRPPKPQIRDKKGRKVTPLTVFPGDGRNILFDTSWPWLLTGKIITSDNDTGSGVLIGDRLVLTARHLMPWNSISTGSWWMKFTPHYFDGTEPFGSSFVSDARHYGTDDTEFNLSHDYAVLRLFEPLGHQLGYIGTTSFVDDWRNLNVWSNIGYPFDVGGGERPLYKTSSQWKTTMKMIMGRPSKRRPV
ncbi:trypsin-like serine peptidase [Bradyrhizobium japonicum]|uniref:trypsin-like serine peptidase n=1 Tax=Bradyrhizobium japonicum TaxID=375 RepID=UPI00117E6729|nr:hypothetical protein [Bradyrhizobium japonicum]